MGVHSTHGSWRLHRRIPIDRNTTEIDRSDCCRGSRHAWWRPLATPPTTATGTRTFRRKRPPLSAAAFSAVARSTAAVTEPTRSPTPSISAEKSCVGAPRICEGGGKMTRERPEEERRRRGATRRDASRRASEWGNRARGSPPRTHRTSQTHGERIAVYSPRHETVVSSDLERA